MRADVCHRIEKIVKNIWPNSIIETIGSTCTDLCVPTRYGCNLGTIQQFANVLVISIWLSLELPVVKKVLEMDR